MLRRKKCGVRTRRRHLAHAASAVGEMQAHAGSCSSWNMRRGTDKARCRTELTDDNVASGHVAFGSLTSSSICGCTFSARVIRVRMLNQSCTHIGTRPHQKELENDTGNQMKTHTAKYCISLVQGLLHSTCTQELHTSSRFYGSTQAPDGIGHSHINRSYCLWKARYFEAIQATLLA